MSLAKALLAFQADAPPVHLDATNPHFRNKYASLGGVVAAVRPALNGHGLVYTQLPTIVDGAPALRTVLMHAESGEQIEDTMPLILSKQDPQGQGSALTYARRYALLSILGLVGDEDDDGTQASAPRRAPSAPAPGVGGPVEPPRSGSRAKLSSQAAADGDASSAGGADGDASPFKPPADALGLQASRADAPPADGGDPGDVVIHFSKNAGKKLSDLSKKQLEWYANEWTPNPQYANAADRRLKVAAQILANGHADPAPVGGGDDPDIPFTARWS